MHLWSPSPLFLQVLTESSLSHPVFGDWSTQVAFAPVLTTPSWQLLCFEPCLRAWKPLLLLGLDCGCLWDALMCSHAAVVLLPPWDVEYRILLLFAPHRSLWGSAREVTFYLPFSQPLLIALFEWKMRSKVTNEDNSKTPSWEYSGVLGLMRVRLLHFNFALMLGCMQVDLWTTIVTSSVQMCHWTQGGERECGWRHTDLPALLTVLHYQVCSVWLHPWRWRGIDRVLFL